MEVVSRASPQLVPRRGEERAQRILRIAVDLFLEVGYDRTSMYEVNQRAGGSKSTLYRYFPTKARLFRAVVESTVTRENTVPLNADSDIRETLTRYSRERMEVVASSSHIALVRLIISESEHNPDSDAAGIYWNAGPRERDRVLTAYFSDLKSKGRLNTDDPAEASSFFNAALIHPWFMQLVLEPAKRPSRARLRAHTARTIDQFLKIYPYSSAGSTILNPATSTA